MTGAHGAGAQSLLHVCTWTVLSVGPTLSGLPCISHHPNFFLNEHFNITFNKQNRIIL
jgi:hypothetical protein